MNKKTNKEKALKIQGNAKERLEKLFFSRGKLKMLDELFAALSDEQKEYSVITAPGKRYTVYEWWKGMTITEKKVALINLFKVEKREDLQNE